MNDSELNALLRSELGIITKTSKVQDYFIDWFEWNFRINSKLINYACNNLDAFADVKEDLKALFVAHENWLNRIAHLPLTNLNHVEIYTKEDLILLNVSSFKNTTNFLKSESYGGDVEWEFECEDVNFQPYKISLADAYFNIIINSTIKRTEIQSKLNKLGIKCTYHNYIPFV